MDCTTHWCCDFDICSIMFSDLFPKFKQKFKYPLLLRLFFCTNPKRNAKLFVDDHPLQSCFGRADGTSHYQWFQTNQTIIRWDICWFAVGTSSSGKAYPLEISWLIAKPQVLVDSWQCFFLGVQQMSAESLAGAVQTRSAFQRPETAYPSGPKSFEKNVVLKLQCCSTIFQFFCVFVFQKNSEVARSKRSSQMWPSKPAVTWYINISLWSLTHPATFVSKVLQTNNNYVTHVHSAHSWIVKKRNLIISVVF